MRAAVTFNAPTSSLVGQSAAARTHAVTMNTKYTVAAGLAKKTTKPGSIVGYKVGDRAPDSAVKSGTTKKEQTLWE